MSSDNGATRTLGVCEATPIDSGAFSLDFSIRIGGSVERVFEAVSTDVGRWWPHTYREAAHDVVMEPRIGGRFMELFDATGRGALYGLVEVWDPPAALRIRGAIAMPLAVNVVFTITLTADGDGTILREQCSVSGQVSEGLREGMRVGTEEMYEQELRAWVERGEALRPVQTN
jgi:uncharacterized protein YndB with AHSA1/START domain